MAKTILVVDDSVDLRGLVSMALTGRGYSVLEAGDGIEALALLEGQKIDLIVSDVDMPNMDGISLITEIKKRAAYSATPIVMLTAEGRCSVQDEGYLMGVSTWIVKPFELPKMLSTIFKLIGD